MIRFFSDLRTMFRLKKRIRDTQDRYAAKWPETLIPRQWFLLHEWELFLVLDQVRKGEDPSSVLSSIGGEKGMKIFPSATPSK